MPSLVENVNDRITAIEREQKEALFNPAVLEAMKLADLYEAVKPQDYILPLDAMVGFPIAAKTSE